MERGIDVAEGLDKNERLDAGKLTENIGGSIKCIKGIEEEAF